MYVYASARLVQRPGRDLSHARDRLNSENIPRVMAYNKYIMVIGLNCNRGSTLRGFTVRPSCWFFHIHSKSILLHPGGEYIYMKIPFATDAPSSISN